MARAKPLAHRFYGICAFRTRRENLTPWFWLLSMIVVARWPRKGHLIPRQHMPHLHRQLVNRMLAVENVLSLVGERSAPEQMLHRWKHKDLANAGLKDGPDSQASTALRAAGRRIRALEKELQLLKDASLLFGEQAVVTPKDDRPSQKDLLRPGVRSGL